MEFDILPSVANGNFYPALIIKNFAYINPLRSVLIDSGAFLSNWTKGLDSFMHTFPNSKFADAETTSRGFGLSYEVLPVYIIPEYKLTDENNHTVYINNLPVAVTEKDFSFSMILSFTTFRNMNFSYKSAVYQQTDNTKKVTLLKNPILRIYPRKQIYTAQTDFENVTDKVLELLDPEYPNIRNRLSQNKILRRSIVLAQK